MIREKGSIIFKIIQQKFFLTIVEGKDNCNKFRTNKRVILNN